jgi:hypothetical protein
MLLLFCFHDLIISFLINHKDHQSRKGNPIASS